MKKALLSVALMAATSIAFAGNPKESKPATEPTETESGSGLSLYWYRVTYDVGHMDGYIPSGTPLFVQAEKSAVESPCPEGDQQDCLRGFTQPLNGNSSDSPGTDQITKD